MKRKKPTSLNAKKGKIHQEEKQFIPSWMSFRLLVLFLFLLAVIVWFGFYAIHAKEIAGSDDREYASIARNIVEGKGIVRNFIYPIDTNFFEKLPVPEFMHPPGYPLILAGFFKLFDISDFSALFPSYLSYFILVLFFIFFAKKYLEIKTTVVATFILIFNKQILDMSLVTLSEGVYTLFFFIFFSLFVRANSLKAIFISGIFLGVSHLIRENIYPFLIPLLVYLYFYPDLPRGKKIVFFIIGLSIPIFFNLIRSFLETGSPLFSYGKCVLMAYTDKYPWLDIYRDIQSPSFEIGEFIWKFMGNLTTTWGEILSVSNPYLLAFFMVEMFYWKINLEWKRVKILFLFLLISQILFISIFTYNPRFFIPFLPLITLYSSQSFLRLSGDLVSGVKTYHKNAISLMVVLLFFIFFIMPSVYLMIEYSGSYMPGSQKKAQFGFLTTKGEAERLNEFLKVELKENQIIWTDLPEILEWEGNRLCGWLPTRIQTIYEIHKKIPVDAILLTSFRTPNPDKMEKEWHYLLISEYSLPRYRTVKIYQSQRLFAKLLIRDEKE